jgi:hypothetical protein
MVIALPLTYVGDRVIEPMSNQAKHYQIGICNLSIKSAPFISRVRFLLLHELNKNCDQSLNIYMQKMSVLKI